MTAEGPVKRSVTVAGHRTSLSLEPEFWDALKRIAQREARTVSGLIGEIDASRGRRNLSSAVRVYVLEHALTAQNRPRVA
ncbi:MAG: ribbon-helix-helix domain-containing protein [Hyphomicrobiales bacterium]